MRNKALQTLIVLFMTIGLLVPQHPLQAAQIRTPEQVKALPGTNGTSSADITWAEPKSGKPKNGYSVELASAVKSLVPDSGGSSTWKKYNVGQEVTKLRVTDLSPSTFYEVMVTANDEYGAHKGDSASFCSPSFYPAEAGCFSNISATKSNYLDIPESVIDPNTSIWNLPDKARKNGSINVTWSAVKGAGSYVVQWYGQQSPIDFGEKEVSASETRTTISGLPGSHLYYLRVLALGANGSYSESMKVRVFTSPGSTIGPVLSGGILTCIGVGDFIRISINSQTQQQDQSDRLKTKAFITRFRKQNENIWQNADQILKDRKRCLASSVYPDISERREYFLPDEISNYEFQVAQVSTTPSGGGLVGDWSYSRWFGPNSIDLNKSEVDKLGPNVWGSPESDAFKTKGTNALSRFQADRNYRDAINKLQIAAADKLAAELKVKQEADAKAAADKLAEELREKQEEDAQDAKKLTITCVKGKVKKKITGESPKCPSGYKNPLDVYLTFKAYSICQLYKKDSSYDGVTLTDGGKTLSFNSAREFPYSLDAASLYDLECAYNILKVPGFVKAQIGSTRAIDGMRKATWGKISSFWTFHPDNGTDISFNSK